MLMTVNECFRYWRKGLRPTIDDDMIDDAFEAARPILDRAKKAEDEGRIKDMQPFMATCNTTAGLKAGAFNVAIRYQPAIDGREDGPPVVKVFKILEPMNAPKEAGARGALGAAAGS